MPRIGGGREFQKEVDRMHHFLRLVVLACALASSACQPQGFNWNQEENIFIQKEMSAKPDASGSVEMRFVSLVYVPAADLFRAFSDVEHHADFIEGVTESKLVSSDGKKRVVDVTNTVFGRPNRARIEWTIDAPTMTMSFRTLESEFTNNVAEYQVEASPDGKRARIATVYHLRDTGGHPFPLHSLKQGVVDGYATAVRSLKRQALGKSAVVGR